MVSRPSSQPYTIEARIERMPEPEKTKFLSVEGAIGLLIAVVAAAGDMNWILRSILVLLGFGVIGHLAWRIPRRGTLAIALKATITLALAIGLLAVTWHAIWQDFHEQYPMVAFQLPITFGPPASSNPPESPEQTEITPDYLGLNGRPLGWMSHIAIYRGGNPAFVSGFGISGWNIGKEEVQLTAAYVISGIDGKRLDLKLFAIDADGSVKLASPDQINAIPPGAAVQLSSGYLNGSSGILESEFLASWATMSLITEYNGTKHRTFFDQKAITESLSMTVPHISPRK
jgi:hypothetical protein